MYFLSTTKMDNFIYNNVYDYKYSFKMWDFLKIIVILFVSFNINAIHITFQEMVVS